jgi:hypothetical protein
MTNCYCFVRMCCFLTFAICSAASISADEPELPKTLDGLEFRSINKFEVSVLPSGPVMSYRVLKFKDGEFNFSPSDYIVSGKYNWDPKRGEIGAASKDGKTYKGSYNPKTKILTWDGARYKAQTPNKTKGHDSKSSPRSKS